MQAGMTAAVGSEREPPTPLRRIRVLHMIGGMGYGGMERLLANLVRLLPRDEFESHIVTRSDPGRFAEGLEGAATLHELAPMPRWSMIRPATLARQIADIGPDVVHIHSGIWYKGSLAARLAHVPRVVYTEHGRSYPDPWLSTLLRRRSAGRTDVVVAVSEAQGAQLSATVVTDPQRLTVVLNGVDTSEFRPRPSAGGLRLELGLPPDLPIIGSVGRLEPIKGYDIMLEAFARLRAEWDNGPAPVLVVAGGGSQQEALAQQIRHLGLDDAAFLIGFRDDLEEVLATFSLFTMSSRSEGTSVSLLEAMSAGLCPVVTDVGGNRAALGPGLAHRLVPPEDPTALAVAWRDVLAEPAHLEAESRFARAHIERHYSLETMVARYAEIYRGDSSHSPNP